MFVELGERDAVLLCRSRLYTSLQQHLQAWYLHCRMEDTNTPLWAGGMPGQRAAITKAQAASGSGNTCDAQGTCAANKPGWVRGWRAA